jgi:hypothetical protein
MFSRDIHSHTMSLASFIWKLGLLSRSLADTLICGVFGVRGSSSAPPSTCQCMSVTTWMSRPSLSLDLLDPPEHVVSSSGNSSCDFKGRLCALLFAVNARGVLRVLPPRLYEEKRPGRYFVTIGRRRGRQEHMIPTLVSTELQPAAAGLS